MFDKYIDREVIHKRFGEGRITAIEDGYATVIFEEKETKFLFPAGFGRDGFVKFADEELQAEVLDMSENLKAEEAEEKRRLYEDKEQEREKSKKKTGSTERAEVFRKTLSYGDSFRTHADALNSCFGFNYTTYQQAYKEVDDKYAVWFASIAKIIDGKYVAADSGNGWINVLSEGGRVLTEKNEDDAKNVYKERRELFDRFVFAKMDDETYTFIGVYRYDVKESSTETGFKFVRLGTKVNLQTMEITD